MPEAVNRPRALGELRKSARRRRPRPRSFAWLAGWSIFVFAACAFGADLGIARIEGRYVAWGEKIGFSGYMAVIDTSSETLRPLASAPDTDRCPAAQPLVLETTEAWMRRVHPLLAFSGAFQIPKTPYAGGCEHPPLPFKSAGATFRNAGGTPAPVLALAPRRPPFIGYDSAFDLDTYEVTISGNSFRHDGTIVPKTLLLEDGRYAGEARPSSEAPHPRLAAGVRGSLLYVVFVEGRTSTSRGISLPVLAELFRACGVETAINLDGGGTATFLYDPKPHRERMPRLSPIPSGELCAMRMLAGTQLASFRLEALPLDRPVASVPIDKCSGTGGGCRGGVRYRPLAISFGFGLAE